MTAPPPWVFFLDRIEDSSYPVTETGYALLYRAQIRASATGTPIYVVYPDTDLGWEDAQPTVSAHRVKRFTAVPYQHFRSQRDAYDAGADVGSSPCHDEGPAEALRLRDAGVVVFRQERGHQRTELLHALASIEASVPVYQSPRLALDPAFGSKQLPARIAPERTPRSWSSKPDWDAETTLREALHAWSEQLQAPPTAIAKPAFADNGVGVTLLGTAPRAALRTLIEAHGTIVVQEYLASVRRPPDIPAAALADVPHDRRDFGEVRFLLVDGRVPQRADGTPIALARRVPTDHSVLADSGISYPTTLSAEELRFVQGVGDHYRRLGIYFGGGDLIRTPDPERPFLFTDAARAVCGHAVVTGALNGDPYLVVDQVLDSIERFVETRLTQRHASQVRG